MITSIDFIIMAAGSSRRFGKNKLLQDIYGRPMFCYVLDQVEKAAQNLSAGNHMASADFSKQADKAQDIFSCRIFVVTRYEEILREVKQRQGISGDSGSAFWQPAVYSPESAEGASFTIKNGIRAAGEHTDYYMFLAADQPCLLADSIAGLALETKKAGYGIGSMCWENAPGNPVLFHEKYVPWLLSLEGDTGGRRVVNKNLSDCFFYQAQRKEELADADTVESLNLFLDYFM